jgi:ribosomal protein L25 (general stress protein Ctc)
MSTKPMQNKHQEHWEDLIITGDLSVLDFFNGDYEVSLKIDGSPAIVYGTNPANGKWFVSTKSAFNKVKIKLCHSHEEIDAHFQGKVADILHACFDYLPRTESIIQCDFICFGDTDSAQPNTITYQFPEVISQKIVVAPHTIWKTDGELKDAYVSGTAPFFVDNDDVKFIQPCVDLIRPEMPQIDVTGVQFLTVKEAAEAKKEINALIRSGEELNWWNLTDILGCKKLAHLYLMMIEIKEDLMDSMIVTDSPRAFIGDEEIVGEGFVLKNDEMIMKLVRREVFSAANFTAQKSWS